MARAERALVLGIGGGGDVVGCIAIAHQLEAAGVEPVLGGVAWERFPVDPHPGPRPLGDVRGAEPIGSGASRIDPARPATTPEGARFAESQLAGFLGVETVLVDVSGGALGAAAGLREAVAAVAADLLLLVDIGGDAIASGTEPGLASPLCDAVMIGAGTHVAEEVPTLLSVVGAGCDGELRPSEVEARVAALARAGAWLTTLGVTPAAAERIEAAAAAVITEASALVARCARGALGEVRIRSGRRRVELGPIGALCFVFDLGAAMAELPLAQAVQQSPDIEAAREALSRLGVATELDYERRRAAGEIEGLPE